MGQPEVYDYIGGVLSAETLDECLRDIPDSAAQYHVGWVALQEAFSSIDPDDQDYWLSRHQLSLEQSQRLANDLYFELKSGAMLLQYPVYKELLKGKLPPYDMASCVYAETTDYAAEVVQAFKAIDPRDEVAHQALHGFKAEVATLMLGFRFPLVENIPTESWFPVYSFPSEGLSGPDRYDRNQSHDISVFTNTYGRAGIVYRTQAVSSSVNSHERYSPAVKVVYVREDLSLTDTEVNVADHIILGCYEELHGAGTSKNSKILNVRTAKLLDILG